MYKFNKFVPANKIWPNTKAPKYKGVKKGLCTGWCIELNTLEGETFWHACTFAYSTPEWLFNHDFWPCYFEDNGWTPTGRISFRGYYIEGYDSDEYDCYYVECDENGNVIKEG